MPQKAYLANVKSPKQNKLANADLTDRQSSAIKQSAMSSTIVKSKITKDNKYLE